ncbi:caspase, EACC1-associated type, partial [Actinophytocola sp.]|uniref:caspase, EACC1-associated type n=1 Tax=Actinophytocola sp. TaxID=1872138 RepID=UPI00389B11A5
MTDASGAFASAVLIGTGRYAGLPDVPSVETTLDDLAAVLTEVCGMAPASVVRVPSDADAAAVLAAVEQAVADARGPLLVYYAGHGLLGPRNDLYLATAASRSATSIAEAVSYPTVRDLLGDAAGGSVVVLDCCFSGRADTPADGAARPYASARPRGGYLISSASNYGLSFAPEGERRTLFSGVLLRALTDGDPAGPAVLTLDRLFAAVDRELREGPSRPRRQSDGSLGDLVVARNRAYRPDEAERVPPADLPCPYPGLEAFRVEDSAHFFGREDGVEQLLAAVAGPDPVVLVGASGVGKSSLLRAGLLAALERRFEAGEDVPWPAVLLPAPGPSPMSTLAERWAAVTGRPLAEVRAELDAGRFPGSACRLLVVDQFEEVFTRSEDGAERAAFVDLLLSAAAPKVVLSVRADHYGSCLAHPSLERAIARGQLTLTPMREEALRAAVERPAAAVGLTVEDGLTDRLVLDLREGGADGSTVALPFLAHALRGTWSRREGTRLTLAGYHDTGGIWSAVATTTDELYASLDALGRRALRQLLLRMVHVTPDAVALRHRVPAAVLLEGLSDPQRQATVRVQERLAEARLITVDESTAQISHEALLTAWPQLRGWIDEDRATLLLRQQLEAAADAWDKAKRHRDFLARGERLRGLRAVAKAQPLRELDKRFLAASKRVAEKERAEELRRARLLRRLLRAAVIALCVALAAGGAAGYQWFEAESQRSAAVEQQTLATQRALAAEAANQRADDPALSLRLGLSANTLHPSAEARQAIFETLASTRFAGSVRLDPDPSYPRGIEASADGNTVVELTEREAVLWAVGDAPRRVKR